MTHERFFVVGFCPSCGTGLLGIRICGHCERPHVLCDECDAIWLDRDTTAAPLFPQQPEIPCAACGQSLRNGASRWATLPELVELTWHGNLFDTDSPASTPRANTDSTDDPLAENDR